MPKYNVKIHGKPEEWVINAFSAYDARESAIETYISDDSDDRFEVTVEEIEEDTVRHDRLQNLLEQLVEGFNDCACCPLSEECKRREDDGIDSIECARIIRQFYLEQDTDWGVS